MMCLTPECQSEELYSRGLCRKCYERYKKRVRRGTIRWQDLIEQGLAKRASQAGPSSEARSAAQKVRKAHGNPYGLSEGLWKAYIVTARKKLLDPDIIEKERTEAINVLSLAGESPDDS